jgi:hypothetical protein
MKIYRERCPLCGQPNECQLCTSDGYKASCWCIQVKIPHELLAQVPPELLNQTCICKDCVAGFWRECTANRPESVQAGDFYFDEKGLVVFKAEYHLRRGYCCGNACRHCPYSSPN